MIFSSAEGHEYCTMMVSADLHQHLGRLDAARSAVGGASLPSRSRRWLDVRRQGRAVG